LAAESPNLDARYSLAFHSKIAPALVWHWPGNWTAVMQFQPGGVLGTPEMLVSLTSHLIPTAQAVALFPSTV